MAENISSRATVTLELNSAEAQRKFDRLVEQADSLRRQILEAEKTWEDLDFNPFRKD